MIFLIAHFYRCKALIRETVQGCLYNISPSVPSLLGGCLETNPIQILHLPPFQKSNTN